MICSLPNTKQTPSANNATSNSVLKNVQPSVARILIAGGTSNETYSHKCSRYNASVRLSTEICVARDGDFFFMPKPRSWRPSPYRRSRYCDTSILLLLQVTGHDGKGEEER